MPETVEKWIESKKAEIVEFMVKMCSIPAVNPSFGGAGEYEKAVWIKNFLENQGLPVSVIKIEDSRVKEGERLNLIARIPGKQSSKTLWIIGHLDTVGAGDLSQWETDPFGPTVSEGKIFGRGTEDNGQAIASAIFTALAIKELELVPYCNVGLLLVSDEEAGSEKGLKHLAGAGIFGEEDEALVPDGGSADGAFVEVAEKSILWCKFEVVGKETHASRPQQGTNAAWVGSLLAIDLINTLREEYCERQDLFELPYSTFELTQRFAHVQSPNVVPGKDTFVIDCRILPGISLDEVLKKIDRVRTKYEYREKVRIGCEILQRVDAPPPTDPGAEVVKRVVRALERRGIEPRIGGIGGGTCAAILRNIGIPAVVWSTVEETAHQPNEYAVIDNLLKDIATMIHLLVE